MPQRAVPMTRHVDRRLAITIAIVVLQIAIARGALGKFVALRFSEWRLSAAESDVALFALKGCNITEIAQMRGAAPGTVRAQLSQIYAKADVTSQSMLVSLFIEDLLSADVQLAA